MRANVRKPATLVPLPGAGLGIVGHDAYTFVCRQIDSLPIERAC